MITVNTLARNSGVSAHAVRYYSKIGLLKPGRHPENGYRLFDRADVARLRFIRRAQALGFSLTQIADILRISDEGASPCGYVRAVLRGRIKENRRKIEELRDLQARMEQAQTLWESLTDCAPDHEAVCHLIHRAGEQLAAREAGAGWEGAGRGRPPESPVSESAA